MCRAFIPHLILPCSHRPTHTFFHTHKYSLSHTHKYSLSLTHTHTHSHTLTHTLTHTHTQTVSKLYWDSNNPPYLPFRDFRKKVLFRNNWVSSTTNSLSVSLSPLSLSHTELTCTDSP